MANRVSDGELARFFQELGLLLRSGIAITGVLDTMQKGHWSPPLADCTRSLSKRLSAGERLSDVLRSHKELFSPLILGTIRVAETTGGLVDAMRSISEHLLTAQRRRQQWVTALAYPLCVTLICLLCLAGILTSILPRYLDLSLSLLGSERVSGRPFLDAFLAWSKGPWLPIFALEALVLVLWALYSLSRSVWMDSLVLRMPWMRPLICTSATIQACECLSQLLNCGQTLPNSLKLAEETQVNRHHRAALGRVRERVERGRTLAEAFKAETALFSGLFCGFLFAGEEAASLGRMLEEARKILAEDLELRFQNLTSLLEPALMVFVGGLVGGSVLLLSMPMVMVVSRL